MRVRRTEVTLGLSRQMRLLLWACRDTTLQSRLMEPSDSSSNANLFGSAMSGEERVVQSGRMFMTVQNTGVSLAPRRNWSLFAAKRLPL
jgi:hypothetical protein